MYSIGIIYEPSTNNAYFSMHEYLFHRILAIYHNLGIILKQISQDIFPQTNKYCTIKKCNKSNKASDLTKNCHALQIKRHKTVTGYSNKSLDKLWLIIISSSPTLTNNEKDVIATPFGTSSQNKIVQMISKIILNHLLRHWNKIYISHQNAIVRSTP